MIPSEIAAFIGVVLSVAGGQILAARWLLSRVRETDQLSRDRDAELHARINEVKDEYVRRDDLMAHITRMEASQQQMHGDIKSMSKRMDTLVEKFVEASTALIQLHRGRD